MKKLFFAALILIVGFAPHVFAEGFTALAPIPGLTDPSVTSVVNSTSLSTFLNSLYKYLVGLAAAIAVVEIIWAGLDIAFFHKDAVSTITDDKGRIYNAVFGLVLVLSPVLVFSIINPSILNLTLNLPEIKTLTTPAPTSNILNANNPALVYSADMRQLNPSLSANAPAGSGWCFSFHDGPSSDFIFMCSGSQSSCQQNWSTDITNQTSHRHGTDCASY